jgi:hypothetical protein
MILKVKANAVHPTAKGIRGGKQYVCAMCGGCYPGNKIAVDHIEPVIRIGENIHDLSYDTIVARIFCQVDNLQVLCECCHEIKSKTERGLRKLARK